MSTGCPAHAKTVVGADCNSGDDNLQIFSGFFFKVRCASKFHFAFVFVSRCWIINHASLLMGLVKNYVKKKIIIRTYEKSLNLNL